MALDLEWNGDLLVNQQGGLRLAGAADAMRQRIFRRILTNPGSNEVPPGYIYHPEYGIGLQDLVGRTMTRDEINKLKQRIVEGILEDADTDPTFQPEVKITEPAYKRMDVFARFRTRGGIMDSIFVQLAEI